jgi:hypothetical protein
VLALQRTAGNASVARLLQRHAVDDAFNAGAHVIMAGETHGRVKKEEEAAAWQPRNITVRWESDLFPVGGTGQAIRFDSPFMHIVVAAREVADLLTAENVQAWISETDQGHQEALVKEVELYRDVVVDELWGQLNQEAQSVQETKAKLGPAQLLMEFLKALAADMRKWYGLNGFQRQLDRGVTSRGVAVNAAALPAAVTKAAALERPQQADDPKLGRSASMVERLSTFAPTVGARTIWKVGEQHVIDALQLTGGQAIAGAAVLHEAQYMPALREQIAPIRQRGTQEFFNANPAALGPALEYMGDRGW